MYGFPQKLKVLKGSINFVSWAATLLGVLVKTKIFLDNVHLYRYFNIHKYKATDDALVYEVNAFQLKDYFNYLRSHYILAAWQTRVLDY